MSSLVSDEATVVAVTRGSQRAAVTLPVPADRDQPARWWRAWRARFGLAEVCGTAAALLGFAAGYLAGRSLLAAGALATLCEGIGFYGCIGAKTAAAAWRATAHLGGWRRLAAGTWQAVREQLASCVVAEAMDGLLIRPGCIAGAAWLLRPLPGGVWIGFAVGKVAADVAWYGMEAAARRGVTWSTARPGAKQATPYLALDLARAKERFGELAVALPGVAIRTLVPCTLTGPSCDSQDTILDEVWLPAPDAGDRVLIGNAGAYTTCYSGRSVFNGYPVRSGLLNGGHHGWLLLVKWLSVSMSSDL